MPYRTISGGLPLSIPTPGTRNYDATLQTDLWQKIADHDHTSGKGESIGSDALSSSAVITSKIADDAVTNAKLGITSSTWTPTLAASGSMTASGTLRYARYIEIGELVLCWVKYDAITTGGVASDALTITLPATSKTLSYNQQAGCASYTDTGAAEGGAVEVVDNSTTANIRKQDRNSWGLGASRAFQAFFCYLRA